MQIDDIVPVDETKYIKVDQVVAYDYTIYVDAIDTLENHLERLDIIRNMTEDDSVRIILTSPGGNTDVALAYLSAIKETKGQTAAHAVGIVASAATLIWAACEIKTIASHTAFMFHNVQFVVSGDGMNVATQANFTLKWITTVMKEYYQGILTDEDFRVITTGGELWLSGEELAERVRVMSQASQQQLVVVPTNEEDIAE